MLTTIVLYSGADSVQLKLNYYLSSARSNGTTITLELQAAIWQIPRRAVRVAYVRAYFGATPVSFSFFFFFFLRDICRTVFRAAATLWYAHIACNVALLNNVRVIRRTLRRFAWWLDVLDSKIRRSSSTNRPTGALFRVCVTNEYAWYYKRCYMIRVTRRI